MWWFLILGVLLIILVGYFLHFLGPAASIVGMLLAMMPLAAVLFVVWLIDRWEPEPLSLKIFALAWGAITSIVIALAVDVAFSQVLSPAGGLVGETFSSVVQAPIVEEAAKGLGVLIIFVIARRAFDGPVDGVVYGALIGAGFAFTENIQYFAISLIEGGVSGVTSTFLLRAVMSPFAHVMFTSLTGLAVGIAARRGARLPGAVGAGLVGMIGAILLHALWNSSATFGDFFTLYLTLQLPLFVGFVFAVVALQVEEARLTRSRLGDYAALGWFTPQEVEMLATRKGRRTGLAWASTLRGNRRALMRSFITDATALAAARQRALSGRDPRAAEDEQVLLSRAAATRAALLAG